MDDNMSKKINFFVQQYNPKYEAISKEVALLHKRFKSRIYNPISDWNFNSKYLAFKYKYFPFGLLALPFYNKGISHIYTSLDNYFFLKLLNKRPLILTGAGAYSLKKLKTLIKYYKKLDFIVVETKIDRKNLLNLGIKENKVKLIYPSYEITENKNKFSGKFIFASSPLDKSHFKAKGVDLIFDAAKEVNYNFLMFWRTKNHPKINLKNVHFLPQVPGPEDIFTKGDVTLYLNRGNKGSKPCPNSIVESICFGRPVIISKACKIADVVKSEKVGIVIEPTSEALVIAMKKMEKNYSTYQKNCYKTAQKHFSNEKFLNSYKEIYSTL
jgi:glycosyltransferase involved in cell wall biosynthesis